MSEPISNAALSRRVAERAGYSIVQRGSKQSLFTVLCPDGKELLRRETEAGAWDAIASYLATKEHTT